MGTYRQLRVLLKRNDPALFIDHLESVAIPEWRRSRDAELQSAAVSGSNNCYYFANERLLSDSPLSVWLTTASDELYVVTILSRRGDLDREVYNMVMVEFYNGVVEPAARQLSLEVELSSGGVKIDDLLPEAAADCLRTFSRTSKKATCPSHPMDVHRWMNFITEAHRGKSELTPDLLEQWLVEEEGWPNDIARQLANEYEFGARLLLAYVPRVT